MRRLNSGSIDLYLADIEPLWSIISIHLRAYKHCRKCGIIVKTTNIILFQDCQLSSCTDLACYSFSKFHNASKKKLRRKLNFQRKSQSKRKSKCSVHILWNHFLKRLVKEIWCLFFFMCNKVFPFWIFYLYLKSMEFKVCFSMNFLYLSIVWRFCSGTMHRENVRTIKTRQ